jgi:hypothetical protein
MFMLLGAFYKMIALPPYPFLVSGLLFLEKKRIRIQAFKCAEGPGSLFRGPNAVPIRIYGPKHEILVKSTKLAEP